jgi:hypothetical protein
MFWFLIQSQEIDNKSKNIKRTFIHSKVKCCNDKSYNIDIRDNKLLKCVLCNKR